MNRLYTSTGPASEARFLKMMASDAGPETVVLGI